MKKKRIYQFLRADRDIRIAEAICFLGKKRIDYIDPRRIQVSASLFILPSACIYHSCSPNAYINWNTLKLKSLKPLEKGETITYHYGTSEYDYSVGAFLCRCGAINCVGYFKGFKYLSRKLQRDIVNFCSPYIKSLWKSENYL